MSLRRLGLNPDGSRHVEDDGPAYARRQGHGGAAMGSYSGTVLKVGPSPAVRSAAAQRAVDRKRLAREAERLGHRRGAREP